MDIEKIMIDYLIKNNYSGLYNSFDECGCEIEDLIPCDKISHDCKAGYKKYCKDCDKIKDCFLFKEGCEWCMSINNFKEKKK